MGHKATNILLFTLSSNILRQIKGYKTNKKTEQLVECCSIEKVTEKLIIQDIIKFLKGLPLIESQS